MKTYIVAHSRSGFDAVVRELGINRQDAVRIMNGSGARGLSLQREQVKYAYDAHLIPDIDDIEHALDAAVIHWEARSRDDQRTHRLTITDLEGGVIGTRMVTARQAKDALG